MDAGAAAVEALEDVVPSAEVIHAALFAGPGDELVGVPPDVHERVEDIMARLAKGGDEA